MPNNPRQAVKQRLDSACNQINNGQRIVGEVYQTYKIQGDNYKNYYEALENIGIILEQVKDMILGVKESI